MASDATVNRRKTARSSANTKHGSWTVRRTRGSSSLKYCTEHQCEQLAPCVRQGDRAHLSCMPGDTGRPDKDIPLGKNTLAESSSGAGRGSPRIILAATSSRYSAGPGKAHTACGSRSGPGDALVEASLAARSCKRPRGQDHVSCSADGRTHRMNAAWASSSAERRVEKRRPDGLQSVKHLPIPRAQRLKPPARPLTHGWCHMPKDGCPHTSGGFG